MGDDPMGEMQNGHVCMLNLCLVVRWSILMQTLRRRGHHPGAIFEDEGLTLREKKYSAFKVVDMKNQIYSTSAEVQREGRKAPCPSGQ